MPAGQYVESALQSPLAHKGYGALAAKYVPKNAAGKVAGGWKAAGGVKGGAIGIGSELLGSYLKPKEVMPTFGGEFGNITDKYQRRLQSAGPGILGGAVKGAGQGAQYGGWYGAGAGAVLGGVYGAAKKHAKTAYSDFLPNSARGAIADAYREYLGRDPEAGAIEGHLAGQGFKRGDKGVGEGGLNYVLSQIKNSPEAMQRGGIPSGGINTGPRAPVNFSPSAIPSSFLRPEQVQMLDETRRRQLGY
jgi:hypothetical protein